MSAAAVIRANRAVSSALAADAPASVQLRMLVMAVASEATLTCAFSPGGRVRGAGVVSFFHCVHCNQARMWHVVASVIPAVERDEATQACAGAARQGVL